MISLSIECAHLRHASSGKQAKSKQMRIAPFTPSVFVSASAQSSICSLPRTALAVSTDLPDSTNGRRATNQARPGAARLTHINDLALSSSSGPLVNGAIEIIIDPSRAAFTAKVPNGSKRTETLASPLSRQEDQNCDDESRLPAAQSLLLSYLFGAPGVGTLV